MAVDIVLKLEMKYKKRDKVLETLKAYDSIIDFHDSEEVFHLFMDLVGIMEEE